MPVTVTGNWTRPFGLNKILGAGLPQLWSCEVPLSCCGCAEPGGWKITHLLCSVKNNEIFSGLWRVRTSCCPGGSGPACRSRDLGPACESQATVALQEGGVRHLQRDFQTCHVGESHTGGQNPAQMPNVLQEPEPWGCTNPPRASLWHRGHNKSRNFVSAGAKCSQLILKHSALLVRKKEYKSDWA